MLRAKRELLRKALNVQFGRGINKADLMEAIVVFIDYHYPMVDPAHRKYFTSKLKNEILHELAIEIHEAGGVKHWKELVSKTIPVIGSLPKGKKQHKPKQD